VKQVVQGEHHRWCRVGRERGERKREREWTCPTSVCGNERRNGGPINLIAYKNLHSVSSTWNIKRNFQNVRIPLQVLRSLCVCLMIELLQSLLFIQLMHKQIALKNVKIYIKIYMRSAPHLM